MYGNDVSSTEPVSGMKVVTVSIVNDGDWDDCVLSVSWTLGFTSLSHTFWCASLNRTMEGHNHVPVHLWNKTAKYSISSGFSSREWNEQKHWKWGVAISKTWCSSTTPCVQCDRCMSPVGAVEYDSHESGETQDYGAKGEMPCCQSHQYVLSRWNMMELGVLSVCDLCKLLKIPGYRWLQSQVTNHYKKPGETLIGLA